MSDKSGFTPQQQQYLQGFFSGLLARRGEAPSGAGASREEPASAHTIHLDAQDRTIAAGGKLVAETAKRKKDPFQMWDEIQANAAAGRFPKGTDVFLTKFHGLFYVRRADSFMCRLRIPNGILNSFQMRGLADMADTLAGGYTDVTTRANLQLREISAKSAPEILIGLSELGLTSRGSGADNIRNVTGSPTAGIDPHELIDTRPLCRELHHHILNRRELYGLPRCRASHPTRARPRTNGQPDQPPEVKHRTVAPRRTHPPSAPGSRRSGGRPTGVPPVETAAANGATSVRKSPDAATKRLVLRPTHPLVIEPPDTDEIHEISGPLPASTR